MNGLGLSGLGQAESKRFQEIRRALAQGQIAAAQAHVAALEPVLDKIMGEELTRDKDPFWYSTRIQTFDATATRFTATIEISNDSFFILQGLYAFHLVSATGALAEEVDTGHAEMRFRVKIHDTGLDRQLTDSNAQDGVYARAVFGTSVDNGGSRTPAFRPRVCVPNASLNFEITYFAAAQAAAADELEIVAAGYKIYDAEKAHLSIA